MRGLLTKLVPATVVLLLTFVALAVSPALASHVQCGDVITQDTTLDSDLVDCPGAGLTVTADGVTLDLNGHLVSTTGSLHAIRVGDSSAVTVENGRARAPGYFCPVWFERSSAGRVHGLDADKLCVWESNDAAVADSVFSSVLSASVLSLAESSRLTVRDVQAVGLLSGQRVFDSVFERTGGEELFLNGDSNVMSKLGFTGQCFLVGDRNLVTHSSCNPLAVVSSVENTVVQNRFSGTGRGIVLDHAHRNLVADNVISRSGSGIELFSSDDNRLERNRLLGNSFHGISISEFGPESERNMLVRNIAHRNELDGIHVGGAPTTLIRNHANHNGEFGIWSVPGVIDGGGNRAKGNGNPLQCLNVFCK